MVILKKVNLRFFIQFEQQKNISEIYFFLQGVYIARNIICIVKKWFKLQNECKFLLGINIIFWNLFLVIYKFPIHIYLYVFIINIIV